MVTKICKCCGKEFTTEKNAQKHCSDECRKKWNKENYKPLKPYHCSWCGIVFEATAKRKFCCKECRERASGRGKRKAFSNNNLMSVVKLAREAGLSYGQYVAKMGL